MWVVTCLCYSQPATRNLLRVTSCAGAPCATRLSVLLVDDEIEHLLRVADVLRYAGMLPTIATSDEEALFDVRTSRPDVVVLDADMADRGLLARIREHVAKLPLVLMIRVSPQRVLPLRTLSGQVSRSSVPESRASRARWSPKESPTRSTAPAHARAG